MGFFAFCVNIASLKIVLPKSCPGYGGSQDAVFGKSDHLKVFWMGEEWGAKKSDPDYPQSATLNFSLVLRIFLSVDKPWDAGWGRSVIVKGRGTLTKPGRFLSSWGFKTPKVLSLDLGLFLKRSTQCKVVEIHLQRDRI